LFRDVVVAVRWRPLPPNFWVNFCVDSVTCFETMSPGLTSVALFSAMSVQILPPVRNVSRPRDLHQSKRRV
jgi:hypothetical protein